MLGFCWNKSPDSVAVLANARVPDTVSLVNSKHKCLWTALAVLLRQLILQNRSILLRDAVQLQLCCN